MPQRFAQFSAVLVHLNLVVKVDQLDVIERPNIESHRFKTIAAFFATTELRNGKFVPVEKGTGAISRISFFMGMNGDDKAFRPVGLQPFQRPGQQCAFGVKLEKGQALEDFQQGLTLQFHQDRTCGQAFLDLFGSEIPNSLFPRELISQIGTRIRKGNIVTQLAINA